MKLCASICSVALIMLGTQCGAQQQTGAPAGIQVPLAPSPVAPAVEAPQSLHFRVRVVDGRNGTAIRNANVQLWYDEPAGAGYRITTDTGGYGNMPAPIGEPVRVLVTVRDFADCRRALRGDPPMGYNLQTVALTGTAAQNSCGQVNVHTGPGELILFVRPNRWYEGLNGGTGN